MKFRLIPKLTAVILTLILCIGCAGSVGYAEGEDKGQSFESLDSPTDFISTDEKKEAIEKSGDLPASFDLRSVDTDGDGIGDRCYVTPVRSQYPFGTCWGFSAIAAAETNILSTVLAYDPDAWKTLNLSEKHLAFFANVWLNDPDSSQYGEGIYSVNGEDYTQLAAEDIYAGGNAFLAAHTFAAGVGPVQESRDELYEYKGKNGKIQESYEAGGINYPTSYSKDDNWLLDESHRYQQDYVLSESYYLPSPALIDRANQYSYNEAGTAVIKEHIKGLNAVAIGFHADESRPWQTSGEGTYMNAVTWAHYTWEPVAANHAVTIIGWDDNYSKENFASGHQPPADGAWLVKNSWGSGLNEFPDKGSGNWGIPVPKTDENGDAVLDENGNEVMVGSGYFWLSYYDQSITTPEVLLFDPWLKGAGTRYDPDTLHRDQYDLMPVGGVREIISQDPAKTANVFEPEKTEHVLNVAFEVATPGTVVNYEIYLLTPDSVSPEDGVLLASGNNSYPYGGYYQEYMDEPVIIQKGQRYSIVTTASLPDGSYGINTPQAFAKNAYIPYGKGIVNEGESLLYINGTWQDWSTDEAHGAVYKDLWEIMRGSVELDNFPIKGIAYDAPLDIGVRVKNVADEKLEIKAGDSADLTIEVFGSEKDVWDAEYNSVEWKVEGEGGQFVSLTPSEDGLSARLSGLKPGTAYVYAYMHDVGTALVTVNVVEAENEPDGSLSTDTITDGIGGSAIDLDKIAKDILSEEDRADLADGADIKVWLEMKKLGSSEVPAADKQAMTGYMSANDLTEGSWLDISLFRKIGDNTEELHKVSKPVGFAVTVPEELRNTDEDVTRTFWLLHAADGKVSVMSKGTGNELKAESSEFSTYTIAYSDKKSDENQKNKKEKNKGNKDKGHKNVDTGDSSNVMLWLSITVISLAALAAMAIRVRRKRKQ